MLVLVVDDSADDELVSVLAHANMVPADGYGGAWAAQITPGESSLRSRRAHPAAATVACAGVPEPVVPDPFTITVGETSFNVRHGRVIATDEPSRTASGTIPADDMSRSPADWAAPAHVAVGSSRLATGQVVEALPESDGSVALSLRSGLLLEEGLLPPMVLQNLTPPEIAYATARWAGFAAANIDVYGLHDLAVEPMWVLAPVAGIRVERTMRLGVVEFVDAEVGREMLRRFSPPLDPVFAEPQADASAFARVAVVARLLYEAEQEGLALIDTASAWLTTRFRYSWSHFPDGALQHYERAPTRITVERCDGVGVLAVDGPRRSWRKNTTIGRGSAQATLAPSVRWTEPPMPREVAPGDRQALFALQRATTASDPIQRVSALWEAIEYYVGKRRSPSLQFTRCEVTAIVERAIDGVEGAQAARVNEVLRQLLNQTPLRVRLEHVLAEEGVPVTPDDRAVLARLRKQRNWALHGATAAPEHNDIDRAVAFMSRAITTRWDRARE